MAGLDPAIIHERFRNDARVKPGHDVDEIIDPRAISTVVEPEVRPRWMKLPYLLNG
jgi:hypothetical protein